jgi:hypothetical protein
VPVRFLDRTVTPPGADLLSCVYKKTFSSRESGAVYDCTLRRTGDFFVGCGPLFGPHRLVTLVIRRRAGVDLRRLRLGRIIGTPHPALSPKSLDDFGERDAQSGFLNPPQWLAWHGAGRFDSFASAQRQRSRGEGEDEGLRECGPVNPPAGWDGYRFCPQTFRPVRAFETPHLFCVSIENDHFVRGIRCSLRLHPTQDR